MINKELFTDIEQSKREQPQFFLAVIDNVYSDGATLKINGTVTQKHYLVNVSQSFKTGDRVKVARISGTYIVEYKIGKPK